MGEILVGITGWTEPTLIKRGNFYPKDATTAEARLRYYASQFPIVEVDSTYYSPPSERNAVLWIERTPKDFVFNIKAYSLLTNHPTKPDRLYKDLRDGLPAEVTEKRNVYPDQLPPEAVEEVWQRFRDALMPLHSAGKLGSVLLQYPRWVFPSNESRQAILDAQRRMGDMPVAVEFRNGSWFNERNVERTVRFLEDNRVPLVMVDGPQGMRSSIPPLMAVTSPDLAIVRFHGRRTETWEAPNVPVVERFRYLYDREELGEWVPRIREAAQRARETHVLMNNCYANYGATNAREIAEMLDGSESEDAA